MVKFVPDNASLDEIERRIKVYPSLHLALRHVRAALADQPSQATGVPVAEWRMVPTEADAAMIEAGAKANLGQLDYSLIYRAMLAAAPASPAAVGEIVKWLRSYGPEHPKFYVADAIESGEYRKAGEGK